MHNAPEPDTISATSREHSPASPSAAPAGAGRWRITGDHLILWAACLAFLISTSIAAMISYKHAYRIALRYGEAGIDAATLPLTVDGLVATCSLVILYRTRKQRRPPWHAWTLLIIAVTATVCANVANGLTHGPVGAIVAGWPALVAVGCFELLMRLLRDRHDDAKPPPDTDLVPEIVTAALHYAADLTDGSTPSIRQLKRDLRIGHAKASRIHHALANRPQDNGLTPVA